MSSFICTNNGCINLDAEVGSEEWKNQLRKQAIVEEDIEKISEFILKVRNHPGDKNYSEKK